MDVIAVTKPNQVFWILAKQTTVQSIWLDTAQYLNTLENKKMKSA